MDIATVTSAEFAPHVGDTFASTLLDGTELELKLTECNDLPASPRMTQGFALLFRETSHPAYDQQIHALRHTQLGEFQIFLVPVGQDERGTQYEAVFSRTPSATP